METQGDLEIVAIDSGDRDYLYRTLDAQLRLSTDSTLVKIEADLTGRMPTNKILESVVASIAVQLRDEARRSIDEALLDLTRQVRYESSRSSPVNIAVNVGNLSTVTLKESANIGLQGRTTDRNLSEELAEIAATGTKLHGGRMVALIDHAEWFAGSEAGREWLRRYTELTRPRTVVHMLVQPPPPATSRGIRREVMRPFQDQDIRDLLPSAASRGDVVSVIREAAHNEPWLIHILVSQVALNEALTEEDLRRALSSGGSSKGIWDFLTRFVFTGESGYLQLVVQRLALLRSLNNAAVEAVLSEVLPAGVSMRMVNDQLRRTHLVDEDAVPQPGTPGFKLLDRVAAVAADEMAKQREAGQYVHELAADHYWQLIDLSHSDAENSEATGRAEEDSVDAGYQLYWTRFESDEWLADLREWIHHSRHTTAFESSGSRRAVRNKLTRWYLEGFFWFEIMASHHFCLDLMAEWEAWAAGIPEEQAWLTHVKTFHAAFGRGADPDSHEPRPDWEAARDAISVIRKGIPLTRGARPPQTPTDESICYAMAMHLEAETIRKSGDTAAFRHAERLYRSAHEWHVDDNWAKAWAIHDRVAMTLAGTVIDVDTVLSDIGEVGRLAEEERDRELQALSMCRFAEALSVAGRHEEAAQAIIAGLVAMLDYNTQQERALKELNNFPNMYTRESYLAVEAVANTVLHGIDEQGIPQVKRQFDAVCGKLFAAFAEGAGRSRSWPPAPALEDLNHTGSDWLLRARRALRQAENMGVQLKTVNTPMPWFEDFAREAV
ncbi:hypothetical protein [Catenulispora pinisilvae]|uniref:hypothetical protein n=1 Tax=Catenulispora pinisilvae TaxID=2705253 RepID=UPI001891697E|nr:hypothetical protein [Catenulispora pinisilvae]